MSKPKLIAPSANRKFIHLEDLYPLILEVFDNGGTFTLTPNGSSMFPTLVGGRDMVTLIRPQKRLEKYDLPLYRRKSGQFVMHRIVAVEKDGSYTCCGDHQWMLEPGIQHEQIVGIATDIVRKGKSFSVDNKRYMSFVKFWTWFMWGRSSFFFVHRLFVRATHLFKKILKKLFVRK